MDWKMIPADCPKCGAAFREMSGELIFGAVLSFADADSTEEELQCFGCNQTFAKWDYSRPGGWGAV